MGFDICVWDRCNNRCLMCTNPERPWPGWDGGFEYDFDSIIKRLEKRKEELLKGDILYLSGGEPTLHPRFIDILQYINKQFPDLRIMLLTNGRTLCYESLPQMLSIINNLSLAVSLHGPNAEIHDRITGVPGSFEQACRGIENILRYQKPDREIEIRVVISRINYKKCGEILSLIKRKFPSIGRVAFIFIEIEGHAIDNLEEVGVKFSDFRPILKKMVPALVAFKKAMLYHFPLCAVPEELWPYVWRTLPEHEVTFLEDCSECLYREYCLGVHKLYLDHIGKSGISPVRRKINIKTTDNFHHPISQVSTSKKNK
jgi:MoaA/NifB/PqqE/SkfB family radical SAM enzyme